MKTIVQLSDIHFGRTDEKVVHSLIKSIREINPDILIISGDLTQRAKIEEFKEAAEFISHFDAEKIIIPGNHDVPMYNLAHRFFKPFHRFKEHINPDPEPFYMDDEVAILGINTARPFTVKNGRVTERQVDLIQSRLGSAKPKTIKILVGHHPFDLPERFKRNKLVYGAHGVMQKIVDSGVDLVLGGHMHISYIGSTTTRYKFKGKAAIVLQAATVSKRMRGEQPSFNLIKVNTGKIHIERIVWQYDSGEFQAFFPEAFECINETWKKI